MMCECGARICWNTPSGLSRHYNTKKHAVGMARVRRKLTLCPRIMLNFVPLTFLYELSHKVFPLEIHTQYSLIRYYDIRYYDEPKANKRLISLWLPRWVASIIYYHWSKPGGYTTGAQNACLNDVKQACEQLAAREITEDTIKGFYELKCQN